MRPLPSSAAYARWLAVVRILTGCIWLSHGIPKFTQSAQFMPPNGFAADFVARGVQTSTGAYHTFLTGVVQPNLPLFAELVRLGEVLVGISLVLGAFSRLGGLVGVVLTLNYIAARGNMLSSATLQSLDFATMVLSLTCLILPAGRALGVDALFTRRRPLPAPATVRAEFVPEPPLTGPSAPPNP